MPRRDKSKGRKQVCHKYLKGQCNRGDKCKYYHPPDCKFHKQGKCKKGDKCKFRHLNDANAYSAVDYDSISQRGSSGGRTRSPSNRKNDKKASGRNESRGRSAERKRQGSSSDHSKSAKTKRSRKKNGKTSGAMAPVMSE